MNIHDMRGVDDGLDPIVGAPENGGWGVVEGQRAYTPSEVNGVMSGMGFLASQKKRSLLRESRVNAAASLLADIMAGEEEPWILREAMMPSDPYKFQVVIQKYPNLFPNGTGLSVRETMSWSDYSALTVDILDRLLYGYYTTAPVATMALVKDRDLTDFRNVARYAMDGGVSPFKRWPADTTLTPNGPGEPPTERAMQQAALEVEGSTQRITYAPQLYQGLMRVNWRAIINDDLGIFKDMTNRLAISGRRTIAQFITSLYMSPGGPSTTLFNNSPFGNLINVANGASINNPSLSFQGIADGMTILEKQLDLDGQPIQFDGTIYLFFGPALKVTANNLIKSMKADISVLGGTANAAGFPAARITVENWMAADLVPVQDKWIRIVCTTAGIKDTTWGMVYDPKTQARPSIELGFLKGFREPQLYQKVPNTMRIGGGVDPALGDFYSMDQEFKGCLVVGGAPIDGRSIVISNGSNN
jgi:hypothetical protein